MTRATVDWQSAACRDHDPELFFPVGDLGPAQRQADRARAVCRGCPLIEECLLWAFDHGVVDGVWGGLSADQRRESRHANMRPRHTRIGR